MTELLARFSHAIISHSELELKKDPTLGGKMSLFNENRLSIFYAPFDWVEPSAKVVIAGITPGLQQASNALIEARRQLKAGRETPDVLRHAKVYASFSGPMRSNLVAMLDHIGLQTWLDVPSSSALWEQQLAHFTSVLRYPVLLDGKNYNGIPSILGHKRLEGCLTEYLAEEALTLPNAIWVPLGPIAALGVNYLVGKGFIQSRKVLEGLPHPSGANAERIAYFLGRKQQENLSAKTNPSTIDAIRARLIAQIRSLQPRLPKP